MDRNRCAPRAISRLARWIEWNMSELSLAQYRLLSLVSDEAVSAKVAAQRLAVSQPTVSTLVMRLEAQGLIERVPDVEDGRVFWLHLTTAGERALSLADEEGYRILHEVLTHALSDGEARDLIRLIELSNDALDRFRATGPPSFDPESFELG